VFSDRQNESWNDGMSNLLQEFSLGGWHISHKANETETVYKFHRSLKIAPGASVTVYSAGKH